jgi:signal transduction histidine kinase
MSGQEKSVVLERLLEVSRRMAETRELEPLLEYIMSQALDLTRGEHGYLVLIDETQNLDFRVTYGHPYEGNNDESPVSHSIIREAIDTQQPVMIRDAGESAYGKAHSVLRLRLRSVLCVPLIAQTEVLGVLYLENRNVVDAFDNDAMNLMTLLASQSASAIKNAQLNEGLEEMVQERTHELDHARREAELGWAAALEENRLRTALLGNITHDLRSPLNIVINALDWMKLGEFGPITNEQIQWLDRSLQATQQVLRLVNDIFDLSKLEQGELELYQEIVYIKPFMEQTLAVIEGLRRDSAVELIAKIDPTVPPIWADPDRVQQILINLFSNAFKFSTDGSVTITVGLDPEQEGFLLFSIADTGEGIPQEDLGRIFDRFHRAQGSLQQRRSGTGLGLAICKELVNRHGGQIWVESEVNVGTVFYFTIPITNV